MAIIKSIYSTKLKGSVGDVVYYNTSAGNIVRTKAASVSNPRTLAQQKQRAKFATVGYAYSKFKTVCNHSIEGITSGQPTQSIFLKENASRVTYANARGNDSVTNNFLLSRGTLTEEGWDRSAMLKYNSNTNISSTLFYGFWAMSASDVLALLGQSDITFFNGLQVTFLTVFKRDSATGFETNGGTQAVYNVIGKQYFVLQNFSSEMLGGLGLSAAYPLSPFAWSYDFDGETDDQSNYYELTSFAALGLNPELTIITPAKAAGFWLTGNNGNEINATEAAGAIILSKKDGDSWIYSTSTLYRVPSSDDTETEPGESAEAWDIAAAADTYNPDSAYYLNQLENI